MGAISWWNWPLTGCHFPAFLFGAAVLRVIHRYRTTNIYKHGLLNLEFSTCARLRFFLWYPPLYCTCITVQGVMLYRCLQEYYSEALQKTDGKKQKVILRIIKRMVSRKLELYEICAVADCRHFMTVFSVLFVMRTTWRIDTWCDLADCRSTLKKATRTWWGKMAKTWRRRSRTW